MPHPPVHSAPNPLFIELKSVDSTNNYARRLIHEGLAQHGIVIFAHEQVAGKGQRGKAWATEKDANIIMSIVFKPGLLLSQQFQLSACAAIAVHDFFTLYGGENTKIKWPNDLYWQDRKAGGILIENVLGTDGRELMTDDRQQTTDNGQRTTQWNWAIIGIGININQTHFHRDLPNPVSLKQITGKSFDPLVLAKELLVILNNYYQQLTTNGFDDTYAQYLNHLYKKEETVKLKKGNRVFEAVIKGVSPAGLLMVRHGIEEEFNFGEVEWIIK